MTPTNQGDSADDTPTPGDGHDPSVPVNIGDVSDEVRAELDRLFGPKATDSTPPPPHAAGEDPTEESESPGESTGVSGVSSTDEGGLFGGPVREPSDPLDREVLAIGDPSDDSVAPLPVDPLLAARDGVVQIIDDHARPDVRDAADVSRVLIIDDDSPVSRADDRERKRRRRRRLRQIKWVRVTVSIVVSMVLVASVLASPLFAVRTVTFEGVVYTAESSVADVRELLDGASVFTVDTAKARQVLLDDPWVAEVRITTSWRGRATVEVAERTPVVWYAGDDQKARVVDARGHVIAVLDGWPTKYLQVRGTGPSLEAGAVADPAYRAAAQLVLALPDEISGNVTALELSPGGELSMVLDGGTVVRFGPPEGLQDKLVAVVVLLRRQDPATLAVVDVSTGEPAVQTR